MESIPVSGTVTIWGSRLLDDLHPGDTSIVIEVRAGGSFLAIGYNFTAQPTAIELEFEYSETGNVWERIATFTNTNGDTYAFLARPGFYRYKLLSKTASGQSITAYVTHLGGNKLPTNEYVPENAAQDVVGPNGSRYRIRSIGEEVTLSKVGLVTHSNSDMLPAQSIILGVVARITESINNISGWEVGDDTMPNRFILQTLSFEEGVTRVGINHWNDPTALVAQIAATPIRIGAVAPQNTAGKIRIVVFYMQFIPPTS